MLKSPDRARNFLFRTMPSKPAILGQAPFPPCSVPTSAEDLTETGPGCLPTFFVCGRANSHSAWKGRGPKKPHVPGPPKSSQGPFTRNVFQDRPLSVSKKVALFLTPIGVRFFAGASASVGLSCTPTCSAISPSCDWPRCADEATPTGISLTHQLAWCRGRFSCKSNL